MARHLRQIIRGLLGAGVFLLAACGGSGSSPVVPTSPSPSPQPTAVIAFGEDVNMFQSNIGFSAAPTIFSLAAGSDVRCLRTGDGGWATDEATQGAYRFTLLDQLIAAANGAGLGILVEIGDGTPPWDLPPGANTQNNTITYAPADCTGALGGETDCAAFGSYVTNVVKSVAPLGVQYLVVWNEPQNIDKNWIGSNNLSVAQLADAYARLLHVAYINAHAADPNIKVLNGGTEILPQALLNILTQYEPWPALQNAIAFTQELYSNSLFCNSIDVLDVHVGNHGPTFSKEIVDDSEQAIQQCNGGRFVPIWVTESGFSDIVAVQKQPEIEAELGPTYTSGDASQQQYLSDTWHVLEGDPSVIGVDWTFVADPKYIGDPTQDGAGLGIVDASFNKKPIYTTMEGLTR